MSSLENLDIASWKDLTNRKDKIFYRFFEILPGILSLSTLFFAVFFSYFKPAWVAYFIIAFDVYWTLKAFNLIFYQIVCFKKMQKNLKINWKEEFQNTFPNQEMFQVIILPTYKEPWKVIQDTLSSIANCSYPKDKIIFVLAQEERVGKEHYEKIRNLALKHYGNSFFKFLVSLHPANLEGEFPGKGANVRYAGKIVEDFFKKEKLPISKTIVSIFDSDTKVFQDYFYKLAFDFLDSKNPYRQSFQPIPIYHNNIWVAHAISRVVAVSNTFWQMRMQEKPEHLVTYSSHSMALLTFLEVGFPHNVVSDDSRIFWKCFFKYNGKYSVKSLFYPVSMDAVEAENLSKTLISLYKQQRRWAYGVIEIPYVAFGFLKNKEIPFIKKISHMFNLIEGFWSWACASLLILLLGWLPVFLGGHNFKVTILSFNLPRLTSKIMTFAAISMCFSALINIIFLPPRPKEIKPIKKLSMLSQWIFLPISLIVFGALPALDAQVRLLLGKYLDFFVTPKERKL
ncbi:MAG: glycosyltransferase [Minisyncoccia bacterium]